MASDKIRVLIVDDIAETRENVRKLLQFESDVDVAGAAPVSYTHLDVYKRQVQLLLCHRYQAY